MVTWIGHDRVVFSFPCEIYQKRDDDNVQGSLRSFTPCADATAQMVQLQTTHFRKCLAYFISRNS